MAYVALGKMTDWVYKDNTLYNITKPVTFYFIFYPINNFL
jgi:hypothetical protein